MKMPPASLNSRRPRRHASRRCSASQFSRTHLTQTRQVLNPDASANAQAVVHYTSYIYNAAGQFTRLIYPSGRTLNISYANGLPSSLGLAQNAVAGAVALMTDPQYAPMGPLKRWNWAMSSGPLAHDRVFDTSGRLIRYPLGEHLRAKGARLRLNPKLWVSVASVFDRCQRPVQCACCNTESSTYSTIFCCSLGSALIRSRGRCSVGVGPRLRASGDGGSQFVTTAAF